MPMNAFVEIQGTTVPVLGFGTWLLYGEAATESVRDALAIGYRHIDTARAYENEIRVGEGIQESGVHRSDLFLTTKIFLNPKSRRHFDPGQIKWEVEDSLEKLGTDYIDLLLLHWPNPKLRLQDILDPMSDAKAEGLVRQLGVSNFSPELLEQAIEIAPVFCNQVEYHPFLSQDRLVRLARERDVLLTAHSPLAGGRVFSDATLLRIAHEHARSPGQVALRWLLEQSGVCAIPTGPKPEWRRQNFESLDFRLRDSDVAEIEQLPKDHRTVDISWLDAWTD
jgi:2,5-diketo-D-gluconate reductase B